uniref:ATP synthase complex subunit 8 n=1 Tax=Perga condei TaxID=32411 RepID=Q5EQP1_9HYME|nr:ATP synthase F0 subunit 8 [Perga condei]
MPQMFPSYWLFIFIFVILVFTLFIISSYFNYMTNFYIKNNNNNNMMTNKNNKYNTKW